MRGRERALLAPDLGRRVLVTAIVLLQSVAVIRLTEPAIGFYAVLYALPSIAFVLAGAWGTRRQGASRDELLLYGAGFGWLVGNFGGGPWLIPAQLSAFFPDAALPFLGHLLLVLPGTRLRSTIDRQLVTATYLATLVLEPITYFLRGDGQRRYCDGCGLSEGGLYVGHLAISQPLFHLSQVTGVLLPLMFAWRVTRKLRTSPASRRVLGPLMAAGVLCGIGVLARVLSFIVLGDDDTGELAARISNYVAFAALPVAGIAFFLVLIRANSSAANISRLLPAFSSGDDPAALQSLLRDSLGDRTLELTLNPKSTIGPAAAGRARTPVRFGSRTLAVIDHDEVLLTQPVAMETAVAALGMLLGRRQVELDAARQQARMKAAFDEAERRGLASRAELEANVGRLRDAFGAYVDPVLAERVVAGTATFPAEELDVTVLFLDLRGFTTYSEDAAPQQVLERINQLWSVVVPIVGEHGGHANKFMGDGMLAVFGAPAPLTNHARRAVDAARAIVVAVRERFAGEVEVSIGIHSGPVVAGSVGGGGRMEFTVIGDVVNTAARIEASTRISGDDVVISGETAARIGLEGSALSPRPAQKLKGKSIPVTLYALVGAPADA